MTTKFNKDMYARMKSKKDEPFSAIGAKSVRVTERWTPILTTLPSTPTPVTVGTTLPTPSVEELTPHHKKPQTADKQKEKLDSRSSSVWDDAGVALAHAHNVFSIDDMKAFSGVFANEVIGRHLHKLVQVPVQVSTFRSSLSPFFSFFFLVKKKYIYIYIYLGVRRGSPSYFGVPSSGGQGRVCVVPYDDLGGRKLKTEEGADIYHE